MQNDFGNIGHIFGLYVCLNRGFDKAEDYAMHVLQRKVSRLSSHFPPRTVPCVYDMASIRSLCRVAQLLCLEVDKIGEGRLQSMVAALQNLYLTRLTNVDALRYCACASLSIALLTRTQNRHRMKDVSGVTGMYIPQVFLPYNRQTGDEEAWR